MMIKHSHNHEQTNGSREPWVFWAGLLVALLIGGLTGAVAMLLMAPQSGKRTRAKIQRQGRELREQTAETVGDVVEQTRTTAREITDDVRKH